MLKGAWEVTSGEKSLSFGVKSNAPKKPQIAAFQQISIFIQWNVRAILFSGVAHGDMTRRDSLTRRIRKCVRSSSRETGSRTLLKLAKWLVVFISSFFGEKSEKDL